MNRLEHIAHAKQAAWDVFVQEYVNCVDPDPADARRRYLETMERLDRAERALAKEGIFDE